MDVQRVVFDANVWVSAAAFPESVPDQVIDLVRLGQVQALISEEIIGQIRRTLLGPRFNVPAEAVQTTEDQIRTLSTLVVPQLRLSVITAKESDNRVLECAVAGRADAIVTGDRKHLLTLGSYDGIPLLSPRQFLDRLDP